MVMDEEQLSEHKRCAMCGKDAGEDGLCPKCGCCEDCCTCGEH